MIQSKITSGTPAFTKSLNLYSPGPITRRFVWYPIGEAKEQFAAKMTVIANVEANCVCISGVVANFSARLIAIGVKRIAHALLVRMFVAIATIINSKDAVIRGYEAKGEERIRSAIY